MLKIVPDPCVLDALITAFPHPMGSAERQFRKYLNKLADLFELSQLRGRNNFAVLFNAYDIPLKELHEYGGTIKQQRIHKWLSENGLSLITNLRPEASNLTGLTALVKVTNLATVIDSHSLEYVRSLDFKQRQSYLDYPNVDDKIASSQALSLLNADPKANCNLYDAAPIDVISLKKYLHQLIDSQLQINPLRANYRFSIAMRILRLAQINDGLLYQLKSPSLFGRNYYKGLSIQTLPKELRGPVLGSAWEYDVKSCATSWKMKYARACYQRLNTSTPFEHIFVATIDFLTDKAGFFDGVIKATFDANNSWSYEKKKSKIKEAFQALSFGAKLDDSEWIDASGQLQHGVLMDILDTEDERHRFQTFVLVEKMNTEQKLIDDYLYKQFRAQTPLPSQLPFLRDRKGWSKSKTLSFLYQHAETKMLTTVANMIEDTGNIILARIHDAIIIRDRIAQADLQRIQKKIIADFEIEYFQLGEKQLG